MSNDPIMIPCKKYTDGLSKYKHQLKFWRLFDSHIKRFFMLKWARRHGKSCMVFNILIRECLSNLNSRYFFIAPTYQSAKNIILKDPDMIAMLPEQTRKQEIWSINQSELTIKFHNGSVLQFCGADKPASLRGINGQGFAVDEWAEHNNSDVWTKVIEPVIRNNGGFCIFIYTPNGVNHASEMYNKIIAGDTDENWYGSIVTAETSKLLSQEVLDEARRDVGDIVFRQEYLCDDIADNDFTIIPQQGLMNLDKVVVNNTELKRVVAVDPGFGGDECVCYYMVNNKIEDELFMYQTDSIVIASQIQQFCYKNSCLNLIVDNCGPGKGVYDILRGNENFNTLSFNSAEKAIDNTRYANKKAEAWFKLRQKIELNVIPPIEDAELRKQLSAVQYSASGNSRIICEKKIITKKRLGRSPDRADAFVYGIYAYDRLPNELRIGEKLSNRKNLGWRAN